MSLLQLLVRLPTLSAPLALGLVCLPSPNLRELAPTSNLRQHAPHQTLEGKTKACEKCIKALNILNSRVITGKSNAFILFPGTSDSDVGLLRKTSLAMMYNGPFSVVQSIVDAFNTDLGSLSC